MTTLYAGWYPEVSSEQRRANRARAQAEIEAERGMDTYFDRRVNAMRAIHDSVTADPAELRVRLEAFRQDLATYEANDLPMLAAWTRGVIARLEKKLEGQS